MNNEVSNENKRTLLFVVLIGAAALFLTLWAKENFLRGPRGCGTFTQCQSNCKNIGTALEMYSTDNNSFYPNRLADLTPSYLKVIPTCAAAAKDTYSRSYRAYNDPEKKIHRYTFYCEGENHSPVNVEANYPQYNSAAGFTARP